MRVLSILQKELEEEAAQYVASLRRIVHTVPNVSSLTEFYEKADSTTRGRFACVLFMLEGARKARYGVRQRMQDLLCVSN